MCSQTAIKIACARRSKNIGNNLIIVISQIILKLTLYYTVLTQYYDNDEY